MSNSDNPNVNESSTQCQNHNYINQLPPQSYNATIVNAQRTIHPDKNYDIIRVDFQINSPKVQIQHTSKWYHLKSEKAIAFFRKEMQSIGKTVDGRGELDGLCTDIVEDDVTINVMYQASGNRAIFITGTPDKNTCGAFNPDVFWK